MSYNVHNFRNGSVINAGPINEMDQQIFNNTVDIEDKLDSPAVAGTSGQVLSIDDNSNVVWATPPQIFDDTAGAGDTDKAWSADKSYNEINTRATKENSSFTGTFSVNRKSGTTVGNNSAAVGYDSEASGTSAIALGYEAKASASYSLAVGYNASATSPYAMAVGNSTTASSGGAFAEGLNTTASGSAAHAENMFTESSGYCSHSQGYYTIANHEAQHVMGMYNIADPSTANPNARGNYVEIVGNGNTDNTRSNARALDWNGNERLAGDMYVHCSSDSTGGYKLISAADVATTTSCKAGTSGTAPVVPNVQHAAAFYGLAKAAGDSTQSASSNAVGTYTSEAKTAIKNMLGVAELPAVTASDNGKVLCVVNGAWAVATIPAAEEEP